MDKAQADAIWKEIIAEAEKIDGDLLPQERTLREICEMMGKSRTSTTSILEKMVQDGRLRKEKRYVRKYNAICVVYSPTSL